MSGEPEVTSEQIEAAFIHLDDIMNRCLIPITLLHETAFTLREGKLGGNQLNIGVRNADLTDGSLSTLRTLAKGDDLNLGVRDFEIVKNDKDQITHLKWNYKGIAIIILVIHRKYNFFENPDYVWYWGETYNIPNPFDNYWKARHLIQ